jgi:hypothetical protein
MTDVCFNSGNLNDHNLSVSELTGDTKDEMKTD